MENTIVKTQKNGVVKKLWCYFLAAIGIVLLSLQEKSIADILIATGGYLAAIGVVELFNATICCKEETNLETPGAVPSEKKLWGYISLVAGLFIAASQVNLRLTLITLGGYLIGTGIAWCKSLCKNANQ